MSIGRELLNVPMGDMIRDMAFAIAEGQYQLDENSINVSEMMGGLRMIKNDDGEIVFDDSRVFFGYEYMTLEEALAYAALDDAISGDFNKEEHIDLLEAVKNIAGAGNTVTANGETTAAPGKENMEIRVPVRHSMMELGFTPTFYQFVDTIIEVKIAIKITRESSYTHKRSSSNKASHRSASGKFSFWRGRASGRTNNSVSTSQVDATYSSKYGYSAEGASILRTKIVPVPPPSVLEDRIRSFMETEEERRKISLENRLAE